MMQVLANRVVLTGWPDPQVQGEKWGDEQSELRPVPTVCGDTIRRSAVQQTTAKKAKCPSR
jgi:hypothetical protein